MCLKHISKSLNIEFLNVVLQHFVERKFSRLIHLLFEGGLPQNKNYLLEGKSLVVQASLTRWVF